jgi:hypothetical protein
MHIPAAIFSALMAWQFAQFAPAATAQQEPAGAISGVLTSADQGVPVRKAQIRLTSPKSKVARSTTTDAEGRYAFTGVAAGEYTLTASRPGYLDMVRGARRPGATAQGTLVTVADGQKLENISWTLPRAGVITGVILDEFGDPAFNVPVRAMRFLYSNGFRSLTSGGNGVSDDRGVYRIAGLQPGEYLVAAVPRENVAAANAQADAFAEMAARARAAGKPVPNVQGPAPPDPTGYVPMYFPGTPQGSGAATVRVGVSEEVPGIDIKLQVLRTVTVAGRLQSTEAAMPVSRLQLIDTTMPLSLVGIWFRDSSDSGGFSFPGVLPGSYLVKAQGTPGGQKGVAGGEMWASVNVNVDDRGTQDVVLTMQRGVTVSGRLTLADLPANADRSAIRLRLYPVSSPTDWEMPIIPLALDASGSFRASNVLPGTYRFTIAGVPEGWVIGTATFSERDAADFHLHVDGSRDLTGELKLTSALGTLTGRLTNIDNSPAPHHTVIVFPADQSMWLPSSRRIHVVQPGVDGTYSLRGLVPGDYRVAAVLDPEPGRHFDREYLTLLASTAASVTISANDTRTVDLRVR